MLYYLYSRRVYGDAMKRNGFTLVEMLAVIALVGALAVIGVATYTRVNESAKQKTLEAKKEQIKTSAIKWAKENSINNKTLISVNALVVEGYLTAEENRVDGIGLIENPVTGDNMICNTVDISFNQGELMAEVNDTVQNCDLATQSLVDDKMNIRVIDSDGHNKTGTGSMSNWTNKNVLVVVSSTEYDSNAVSISFDFEGSTTTKQVSGLNKYTGNGYLDSDQAKLYYNVFNVDANLLLNTKVVVSYTLTNGTIKSRAYTVRIDKEEATASIKSNNEWLTVDKPIYVLVDDGKGSGPKYFYVTTSPTGELNNSNKYDANNFEGTATNLEVGKYFIWTEDNAGNRSVKPKMILEINNVDKTVPECEVIFEGTVGDHGWYKENPVQPYGHNTIPAGISGFNLGVNQDQDTPVYTAFAYYNTDNKGPGELRNTNTVKAGELYWCHAKTIAGNYAQNDKRLYLDMTPPTIDISVTNPNVHTKTKDASITLYDALSGLNATTNVRIGFSLSPTSGPTTWETVAITAPEQTNEHITKTVTVGSTLTGTYYLYIDTTAFKDYAGNYPNPPAMANGHYFVYGPYKFDNTPPKCNGNNGKTNWTKGEYTINQLCIDNVGTEDQSRCVQDMYSIYYGTNRTVKSDSVTIYDNAGNTTVCPYDVYLDNTPPVCDGRAGKTNWTKGTYTVVQKCGEDVNTQSGCSQPTFSRYYGTSDTYKTHNITISDNVGNTTVCNTDVYLDNTPPVCGGTTGQNSNWAQTARTVIVGCSDGTNQSGCTQPTFSKRHADTNKQDTIIIKDNVDNQTVCGPYNYYVDVTKPTCDGNNGKTNWTSGSYTIRQSCGDGTNQSGCKKTVWVIPYTSINNVQSDYVIISDNANNNTRCDYDVYLDNVKPTCELTPSTTAWTNQNVTMTLKPYDNLSGIPTEFPPFIWQFPINNNGITTGTGWTSLTTREVGYNGTVTATIRDRAKNENTCSYAIANIDKEAPTCTGTIGGYDSTSGITYVVTCDDTGGSGCSSGFGTHGPYQPTGTSETHSYSVKDRAGNTTGCGTIYVWGQKQAQALSCSSPNRCPAAGCQTWKSCTHSSCEKVDCNCSNCKTGSNTCKYGCAPGYYSKPGKNCDSCDSAGDSDCWSVDAEGNTYNHHPESCTWHKGACSDCYTGSNTCKYGCDKCDGTCRIEACGCETYNASCSTCGCSAYNNVINDWHDENNCNYSKTNCNVTDCRWVFRASKQ